MNVDKALKRLSYFRLKHKLSLKEEKMLEALADAVTVWHPYPKEKPQNPLGYYLVTLLFENGYKMVTVMMTVEDATFGDDSIVIAWAEMPKPYGEGEK